MQGHQSREDLEREIGDLRLQNSELVAKVTELESGARDWSEIEMLKKQINSMHEIQSDLGIAHSAEVEDLKEEMKKAVSEKDSLQEMVDELIRARSEGENKLYEMKETENAFINQRNSLQEMISSLLDTKEQGELAIANANAKREAAERERDDMRKKGRDFAKAMKMMQSEINRLKTNASVECNSEERDRLLQRITELESSESGKKREKGKGKRSNKEEVGDEMRTEIVAANEMIAKLRQDVEIARAGNDGGESTLVSIETAKREMEQKVSEVEAARREMENRNDEMRREFASVNEANLKLQKDIETLRGEASGIENARKELERKLSEIEVARAENDGMRREIDRAHKDVESKISEIDAAQREVESAKKEVQRKMCEVESFRTENDRMRGEIEVTKSEMENRLSDIETSRLEVAIERDKMQRELVAANEMIVKLHNDIESVRTKNEGKVSRSEVESAKREMDEKLSELEAARNENCQMRHEIETQRKTVVRFQEQLDGSLAENAGLRERVELAMQQLKGMESEMVNMSVAAAELETLKQKQEGDAVKVRNVSEEAERQKERHQKITLENTTLSQALEQVESENTILKGKIANSEARVEQVLSEKAEATSTCATYVKLSKQLNSEKAEMSQKLASIEARLVESDSHVQDIDSMRVEVEQLREKIQSLEADNARVVLELRHCETSHDESLSRIRELLDNNAQLVETASETESLREKCTTLQSQADESVRTIGELEAMVKRLENELFEGQQMLSSLSDDRDKTSEALVQATSMVARVSAELSEAMSRLDGYESQVNGLESEAIRLTDAGNKALDKKDKMIVKLKTLLQRSVNSDQRKEQQIATLQSELKTFTGLVRSSTDSGDPSRLEIVVALEVRNQDLEKRLAEAQPSAELQSKNERLARMLEKSNMLYSEVSNRNKELLEQLRSRKSLPSLWHSDALTLAPSPDKSPRHSIRSPTPPPRDDELITNAYLRSTLIQFFSQDSVSRASLVPLILELVGCTRQQIRAAKRQWERSNQLIQKTTGFFGF